MSEESQRTFELDKLAREQAFEREMAAHDLAKLGLEQSFDARKVFAQQTHDLRLEMLRFVHSWGQLCLRSGLVLNGGAILAVLTLLGATAKSNPAPTSATFTPEQFGGALLCYSLGLLCTCIAMFLAYVNWSYNSHIFPHIIEAANNLTSPTDKWPGDWNDVEITKRIRRTMYCAILFGFVSYGVFVIGCLKIGSIFGVDLGAAFSGWFDFGPRIISWLRAVLYPRTP